MQKIDNQFEMPYLRAIKNNLSAIYSLTVFALPLANI